MPDETGPTPGWKTSHVFGFAVICLLLGMAVGFLVRGSAAGTGAAAPKPTAITTQDPAKAVEPTPEQLQHMAEKAVQPLLAKLAEQPADAKLLAKIGDVYSDARQFKQGIEYYNRALKIQPRNADVRTDLATAYFYSGNTDAALAEFNRALQYEPKHVGALFNVGVVKWQGKNDAAGAVASWERLLKANPDPIMKQRVQGLIAKAKEHLKT